MIVKMEFQICEIQRDRPDSGSHASTADSCSAGAHRWQIVRAAQLSSGRIRTQDVLAWTPFVRLSTYLRSFIVILCWRHSVVNLRCGEFSHWYETSFYGRMISVELWYRWSYDICRAMITVELGYRWSYTNYGAMISVELCYRWNYAEELWYRWSYTNYGAMISVELY